MEKTAKQALWWWAGIITWALVAQPMQAGDGSLFTLVLVFCVLAVYFGFVFPQQQRKKQRERLLAHERRLRALREQRDQIYRQYADQEITLAEYKRRMGKTY